MKQCVLLLAVACMPTAALAAEPHDVHALFHQYKCDLCHADDQPKAGPAFRDVAAAYRGNRGASSAVVRAIKRGQHGGGWWHMPPHPEVSDAQAAEMARYILSLK